MWSHLGLEGGRGSGGKLQTGRPRRRSPGQRCQLSGHRRATGLRYEVVSREGRDAGSPASADPGSAGHASQRRQ